MRTLRKRGCCLREERGSAAHCNSGATCSRLETASCTKLNTLQWWKARESSVCRARILDVVAMVWERYLVFQSWSLRATDRQGWRRAHTQRSSRSFVLWTAALGLLGFWRGPRTVNSGALYCIWGFPKLWVPFWGSP